MKHLKTLLTLLLTMISGTLTACGSKTDPASVPDTSRVLTIYFSCTGTTADIAEKIHNAAGGDLVRIEPAEPYTRADLDYNSDCRANKEQNDPSARPAIKASIPDTSEYDIVFLGYPIWWSIAPKIVYTLLESNGFSGKTIIPFCTSGSSGIKESESDLHALVPTATWLPGRRFNAGASQFSIDEWVKNVMP